MTVGICHVVDYLGDFLLVHCFMFFNSSSYSEWNRCLGYSCESVYRKIEKKKDKNRGWPTKIIGKIEQKKMRYLRRQRISNKHNKNNLLPKVKIIFKRSIFIGDEFYFKIPLYPHGRGG